MAGKDLVILQGEVKSIGEKLNGMTGWMKDIRLDIKELKNHVDGQNGKVAKTELKIALIEQRLQLKKEYENKKEKNPSELTWMDKLEFMPRKRLMGLIVAFLTAIMFFVQLLLEFIKDNIFK